MGEKLGRSLKETSHADVLVVCGTGYTVTVSGFLLMYLLGNRITDMLYRAAPPSLEVGSPISTAIFYGPRLLAAALLIAALVVTDVIVTRRLADSPQMNRRATVGWVALATALAWIPLALLSVLSVGYHLLPLFLLDHPLISVVVLVPLGVIVFIGGVVGYYAPIGVAIDGQKLWSSVGGGWPRLRARPLLAVRALATLVLGWVLGGAIMLVGLFVILVAIALIWVAVGALILPFGLGIYGFAVVVLTGGHVGYRRATMRA